MGRVIESLRLPRAISAATPGIGPEATPDMQLAMHNWMRPEPIEVTARRLAKYGYDSIEIAGLPDEYDTAEVSRVLRDERIRCWGSTTMMEAGLSLIASDEAVRAHAVAYLKDVVTMVKELDGQLVTVVPAEIGNATPEATPEEEWAWAVESMREVYDYATSAGVRIAIEPINRFETHFINRIDQALALADAIGPGCGICPDAFHLNIEESDPYDAIAKARGRIIDFHVSDSNQLACGMGHLEWPRLIQTLRATGYDGALAVEFVPTVDRTPANRFPGSVEDYPSKRFSESFYSSLVETCARTLRPLISERV